MRRATCLRRLGTLLSATLLLFTVSAGCPLSPPSETFNTSLVVKWNEVALAAVRNGPPRPTVIARSMFLLHSAMYEAWAQYDDNAKGIVLRGSLRRPLLERTVENKSIAISYAAYAVLADQFPAYETNTGAFSRLMDALGLPINNDGDETTPQGIGRRAAEAVLAARLDDGSNAAANYADLPSELYPELYAPVNSADPATGRVPGGAEFNPNRWQPLRVPNGTLTDADGNPIYDDADPGTYTDQRFLTPHWGAVRPFALARGDALRPAAPPQFGSTEPYTDALGQVMTNDAAYRAQFTQILEYSAALTDEQKVIAEYWADGPRSETPPGHWNALAHGVCFRDKHTLDDDVKMFFALNGALLDASIAVWDAKRVYDFVRPQSAIRNLYFGQMVAAWAGPDEGTQMIAGENWRPYQALTFVTPPFAEYVSGHSAFSAAAAAVLRGYAGSDAFYDGRTILFDEDFNSDGLPDLLGEHVVGVGGNMFEGSPAKIITLRWRTFTEAANEAGISRRYGGIHIQDGDLRARDMGREIGDLALQRAREYWTGAR